MSADFSNWQVRVFPQGRWWRYEVRRPSGGGTVSKGYHTAKGAVAAMKASFRRMADASEAAEQAAWAARNGLDDPAD